MRASLHHFALPFREPLDLGGSPLTHRRGCLVRIEDDDGHVGWGEAAALPGLPGSDQRTIADALAAWCARPDRAGRAALAAEPVAAAAVDTALVSLEAARHGLSLSQHLAGETAATHVPVNALLHGADAESVAAEAATAVDDGYRAVKLKVGRAPVAVDLERIAAVRRAVGTGVAVRIDANRIWSAADAHTVLDACADHDIEYAEEPTADLTHWPDLARHGVPLAADESLAEVPDDALALLRDGHVAVLVAKIPLLSGVRPALAAAGVAATRGGRVSVTSFFDSAVGLAAALHVAAALRGEHPAAGLATGHLLAADVAPAPLPVDGVIAVPEAPGLGVEPDLDSLD